MGFTGAAPAAEVVVNLATRGEDYYYWPCATGEPDPPTLTGAPLAQYARRAGESCIHLRDVGARATWSAYTARGKDFSGQVVMVMRAAIERPGVSGPQVWFGFRGPGAAANNSGPGIRLERDTFTLGRAYLGGEPVAGSTFAWPAWAPPAGEWVDLELRWSAFATGGSSVARLLIGGAEAATMPGPPGYLGDTDQLCAYLLNSAVVGGYVTNVWAGWDTTL